MADELTPEQRELWTDAISSPSATDGQTVEQARAAAGFSFRHVCALEGVGVPSEEAVLAELTRRAAA